MLTGVQHCRITMQAHTHTGLNSVIEACKELSFTEAVKVPAGSAEDILLVHTDLFRFT